MLFAKKKAYIEVDEGMSVILRYSLKHGDPAKTLRCILECMFQVFQDSLVTDGLFDFPLRFDIEWIGIEPCDVSLCFHLYL
jgi:hypothetical protein